MAEEQQQEMLFAEGSGIGQQDHLSWFQQNLDITFPLLIIAIGLFQFVLRKWLMPVSDQTVETLEDQFPGQGLIYNPGFGLFLILGGVLLLLIFHLNYIF